MKQEALLKLFNKYGFYSLKKEPFLYDGKEGLGICFTYNDPLYGVLTRLFIPKNLDDAEEFLAKYSWFKKNGSKYQVTIALNDYKVKNPIIKFIYQKRELTWEELKKLSNNTAKEKKINEKDQNYLRKLKRTGLILIQVIEEKIKIQNTTYLNLINLTNEYIDKQNELNFLLKEFQKSSESRLSKLDSEKDLENYTTEINAWKEQIHTIKEKNLLEEIIYSFIYFLKSLETEEGLLKNKYELIKLPLELEIIKEKIKIIKNMKEKKKLLFAKKDNIDEMFSDIEIHSPIHNIVTFKHYQENEIKRIEEKYMVIPDLDIRTIGDYFAEFDNIKIKEPIFKTQKQVEKGEVPITFETTMKKLEKSFLEKSKQDQELLIAAAYLFKNVDKNMNFSKEEVKNLIALLENPNNIMIKIKYFKDINISSVENCRKSIKKLLDEALSLPKDKLKGNINVFLKDSKKIGSPKYIKASSKRLLAPIQEVGENDVTYIADLKKDTEVFFVPWEITLDIENDDTLILKQSRPFFIIDIEEKILKSENDDIIKVARYIGEKYNTASLVKVINLENHKTNLYQNIRIGE